MANGNSAVFLDRDGVLTVPIFRDGRSYASQTMEEYALYDAAAPAVAALKRAGFLTVVVTNQPDVGAGIIAMETLEAMHAELASRTDVDVIMACTHTKTDGCACRKPKAGMLLDAAATYDIDLTASFMVGDRKSDVDAGIEAGCRTVFLDLGYTAEEKPINMDQTCSDIGQAAEWIIDQKPACGTVKKQTAQANSL